MAIVVSKNYFFCARFLERWVEWCWMGLQRNGEFDINQVLIVEPVLLIGDLREAETFFSRLWGHSNSQELFWSRTRNSFGSCSIAFLNLSRTCPMTLRAFISVLKNARKFPKRSIKNVLKSARELPKRSIKNVLKSARDLPKRSIKNIKTRWQAERKPQKRVATYDWSLKQKTQINSRMEAPMKSECILYLNLNGQKQHRPSNIKFSRQYTVLKNVQITTAKHNFQHFHSTTNMMYRKT